MDIDLCEYYYNKFLYYVIKYKCYKSFKKHKNCIKESINKIIKDNNDYLLTESFISYLAKYDLYMNLAELATNDKYLIYELISSYYHELIKYITFSDNTNTPSIRTSYITYNMSLQTQEALTKLFLLFVDMTRLNDLTFHYYYLIKQTIYYMITYCHINNCMDKFGDLISNYKEDIYKLKDEIMIHGLDITDPSKELIDIVSKGSINRNKKIIK